MKARARSNGKKSQDKIVLHRTTLSEMRATLGITPREMRIARRALAEVLGINPEDVGKPPAQVKPASRKRAAGAARRR